MTTAKRDTYTPETLLSVAVRVFNERGYDGTSMEHLSKAAGISKSSIYHHVTGKEELLRRAVSRALDGLFGILDEEHARVGRAVERLEYVTRRMVEVLTAELPYVTLLLRVRGNTDAERWALERRRDFDHRVAELLRAAAADGDVRVDVEFRLATRLVFGMINSIVEWYRPDGRGMGEREVADAVVRLVFGGSGRRTEAGWSIERGPPRGPPRASLGRRGAEWAALDRSGHPCGSRSSSSNTSSVRVLSTSGMAWSRVSTSSRSALLSGVCTRSRTSKSPPTSAMWEAPGSALSCSRTVRQEFCTILSVMYAEVLCPARSWFTRAPKPRITPSSMRRLMRA